MDVYEFIAQNQCDECDANRMLDARCASETTDELITITRALFAMALSCEMPTLETREDPDPVAAEMLRSFAREFAKYEASKY